MKNQKRLRRWSKRQKPNGGKMAGLNDPIGFASKNKSFLSKSKQKRKGVDDYD